MIGIATLGMFQVEGAPVLEKNDLYHKKGRELVQDVDMSDITKAGQTNDKLELEKLKNEALREPSGRMLNDLLRIYSVKIDDYLVSEYTRPMQLVPSSADVEKLRMSNLGAKYSFITPEEVLFHLTAGLLKTKEELLYVLSDEVAARGDAKTSEKLKNQSWLNIIGMKESDVRAILTEGRQ